MKQFEERLILTIKPSGLALRVQPEGPTKGVKL